MEKIKDVLHELSDLFLALIIICMMFAVIALNLGSWFSYEFNIALADKIPSLHIDNIPAHQTPSHQNSDDDHLSKVETDVEEIEVENDEENLEEDPVHPVVVGIKTITIPHGTPAVGIASILLENELIDDTSSFIRAVEELKLSSKLKYGTFRIPTNISVYEIARLLAN